MNRALHLITLCESLAYPAPVLPSKYPRTKDGWISYIKDVLKGWAKGPEEAVTGDDSCHFFYSLTVDSYNDPKMKNFLAAVRELEKSDYFALYAESPDGTSRHELYYLGRKEFAKLQSQASKDDSGWDSAGAKAYAILQSAAQNAAESSIKNISRYHNDIEYHPKYWVYTYGSIGGLMDDADDATKQWFKQNNFKW